MNSDNIRYLAYGFIFVLMEVLIFQHLPVFGITPDPLLLFLLWITIKFDRAKLVIFAAAFGLLQDILFDTWGLNMFSKTFLCFFIYNFLNRTNERQLIIWQIFLITLITSIIHNLIFLGLSAFTEAYATGFYPMIFIFLKSIYTAFLGAVIYIFKGS